MKILWKDPNSCSAMIKNKNFFLTESNDKYEIKNKIPRFVDKKNYTDAFGMQWNYFRKTQLDSYSKFPLSEQRLKRCLGDNLFSTLKGKLVLEAGCGAGRFTEIFLSSDANVVSFDYSNAVDANYASNSDKGDVFIFQGDLYDIPFPDEYFDYIFCFGVLQHTPNPLKAYNSIYSKLKKGGSISIDYYLKFDKPTPWSTPKYFWRPVTAKMDPQKLLRIIKLYIPIYLPIDTFIRKIPKIGSLITAIIPIPCWNYVSIGLNKAQRVEWAIMDTFDALSATYDTPKTLEEVREMVGVDNTGHEKFEIFYGSNGVVVNILKK